MSDVLKTKQYQGLRISFLKGQLPIERRSVVSLWFQHPRATEEDWILSRGDGSIAGGIRRYDFALRTQQLHLPFSISPIAKIEYFTHAHAVGVSAKTGNVS